LKTDYDLFRRLYTVKNKRSPSLLQSEDYWMNAEHQHAFVQNLSKAFHITKYDDWYQLKVSDIIQFGGKGFLKHFGGSFQRALKVLFPEYHWRPWLFATIKPTSWNDRSVHLEYIEWLSNLLGITEKEQWYAIRTEDLKHIKSANFILKRFYGNSLVVALTTLYPDTNWQLWRFSKVPRLFWNDERNIRNYFLWVANELQVCKMSDWYEISTQQIYYLKGIRLLQKNGGLLSLLPRVFPHFDWDRERLAQATKINKAQLLLYRKTQQIFPSFQAELNFNFSEIATTLDDHFIKKSFELDVYLPELSLSLEYQGRQHYHWHFVFGSPSEQQAKDGQKKLACICHGITLVEIPYWWDQTTISLLRRIRCQRPDLVLSEKEDTDIVGERNGKENDVSTSTFPIELSPISIDNEAIVWQPWLVDVDLWKANAPLHQPQHWSRFLLY